MSRFRFKYQLYGYLFENMSTILADIDQASVAVEVPPSLKGRLGLFGDSSSCPGILLDEVAHAMFEGANKTVANKILDDKVRELVKDQYGDTYDAVVVNTCDAALRIVLECLATPSSDHFDERRRSAFVTGLERHIIYAGAFGSPYPSRYKDILSDRSTTSGEHGLIGKRLLGLDALIVPLEGARYDVHGIRYFPACLLAGTNAIASAASIEEAAKAYPGEVTAIVSLGYDSLGYGFAEKTENDIPIRQLEMANLARRLRVPYVIDNAHGAPFLGTDIRRVEADVICYSMDKVARGPTAGLIIGKEEFLVPIRRAVGVHGERWGVPLSHGVARFSMHDPGRHALLGVIAALKVLRDRPQWIVEATDKLYQVVLEEMAAITARLSGIRISKSYNSGFVEVNYEATWGNNNEMGFPIFTIEDSLGGTDLISMGVGRMGVIPGISYDANILISAGLGTIDGSGRLLVDETRLAVKSLVAVLRVIAQHAGVW